MNQFFPCHISSFSQLMRLADMPSRKAFEFDEDENQLVRDIENGKTIRVANE